MTLQDIYKEFQEAPSKVAYLTTNRIALQKFDINVNALIESWSTGEWVSKKDKNIPN
jgi:hypothetical protein